MGSEFIKKTILSVILANSVFANKLYITKPGDTLSEILYMNTPGRIYGKNGSLNRLLKINDTIKDKDVLSSGMVVKLPTPRGRYTQYELEKMTAGQEQKKLVKNSIKEPKKKLEQYLQFTFSTGVGSLRSTETLTETEAIATSDNYPGLTFEWQTKWSEKLYLYFIGSFIKNTYTVKDELELVEDSFIKKYFGTGVGYKTSNDTSYNFGFGLGDSLVLTAKSSTELKINKHTLPVLNLSRLSTLYKQDENFKVNGRLMAGLILPTTQADYDTDLGYYFKLGLYSDVQMMSDNYTIGLNYSWRKIQTDDLEQRGKSIVLSISRGFSF